MSDLLSGLRVLSDDAGTPGRIYNQALGDVLWRLRNPTDEQVEAIDQVWRDYHYSIYDTITGQLRCACGEKQDDLHRIRVYLAAAAGGDDE